jgi:hypothetical protein
MDSADITADRTGQNGARPDHIGGLQCDVDADAVVTIATAEPPDSPAAWLGRHSVDLYTTNTVTVPQVKTRPSIGSADIAAERKAQSDARPDGPYYIAVAADICETILLEGYTARRRAHVPVSATPAGALQALTKKIKKVVVLEVAEAPAGVKCSVAGNGLRLFTTHLPASLLSFHSGDANASIKAFRTTFDKNTIAWPEDVLAKKAKAVTEVERMKEAHDQEILELDEKLAEVEKFRILLETEKIQLIQIHEETMTRQLEKIDDLVSAASLRERQLHEHTKALSKLRPKKDSPEKSLRSPEKSLRKPKAFGSTAVLGKMGFRETKVF